MTQTLLAAALSAAAWEKRTNRFFRSGSESLGRSRFTSSASRIRRIKLCSLRRIELRLSRRLRARLPVVSGAQHQAPQRTSDSWVAASVGALDLIGGSGDTAID